jgi:hypothetical protein
MFNLRLFSRSKTPRQAPVFLADVPDLIIVCGLDAFSGPILGPLIADKHGKVDYVHKLALEHKDLLPSSDGPVRDGVLLMLAKSRIICTCWDVSRAYKALSHSADYFEMDYSFARLYAGTALKSRVDIRPLAERNRRSKPTVNPNQPKK